MDFKGITWVGNMYQKFENICLEVEDIMYQDTVTYFENHVKYVEDQVETVGESVKKFCSEFVQDLLLSDSLEVANSNLPLDQHDNIKKCKKPKVGIEEEPKVGIKEEPKVGIKEECMKFDINRLNEVSEIAGLNKDVEYKSSFGQQSVNDLFQSYSGDSVKHLCSDMHLIQNDDGNKRENLETGKRKMEKLNQFPVVVSRVITPMSGSVSSLPSSLNRSSEIKYSQMAITLPSPSDEITEGSPKGVICNEIAELDANFVDLPSAPFVESVGMERREIVFSSRAGKISAENGVGSQIGSSASGLQQDNTVEKEVLAFQSVVGSGGWDMGVAEIKDVLQQGIGTTEESPDKIKLEDSCIVVDGEELHVVSHNEAKIRLVKKLRNAFCTKSRLARKEYERLAVWHKAIDSRPPDAEVSTPSHSMESDERTSPDDEDDDDDDFCQCEWELL